MRITWRSGRRRWGCERGVAVLASRFARLLRQFTSDIQRQTGNSMTDSPGPVTAAQADAVSKAEHRRILVILGALMLGMLLAALNQTELAMCGTLRALPRDQLRDSVTMAKSAGWPTPHVA